MVYGCWGDHLGDAWAYSSYCATRGLIPTCMTKAGSIEQKLIEIQPLLGITTGFSHMKPELYIDEFDAWRMPYRPTVRKWSPNHKRTVAIQFDGRLHADIKNPPPEIVDYIRNYLLQNDYTPISVGGAYSLAGCVSILAEAEMFIGVDSGMSHVAHSVGVPCVIVQNRLDVRPYHTNKEYKLLQCCDVRHELPRIIQRASNVQTV